MRYLRVNDRRGFSLLELLVVMAIIALLAGITMAVIPAIKRMTKRTLARREVDMIVAAAESYYRFFDAYPPDTGIYETDDQPPTGLDETTAKYSITRYLGMDLTDT